MINIVFFKSLLLIVKHYNLITNLTVLIPGVIFPTQYNSIHKVLFLAYICLDVVRLNVSIDSNYIF